MSSLARPLDVVAPWLSSRYLIMHSTHVGGSSHVSDVESESLERSEFTLCSMRMFEVSSYVLLGLGE